MSILKEPRPRKIVQAGLRHCYTQDTCDGCPYVNIESSYCQSVLMRDASETIQTLMDRIIELETKVEFLERDEEDDLTPEEREVGEYIPPDEGDS